MKRNLLVVVLALQVVSCSDIGTSPESKALNLKFSYGIDARNVLNTFENAHTKDLILDGTTTVPFTLSDGELERIGAKMSGIVFFVYPEHFAATSGDTARFVMPYSTCEFDVSYKSTTKRHHWSDSIISDDTAAVKLRELIQLMKSIIESKPEYSQLPPARGGYL